MSKKNLNIDDIVMLEIPEHPHETKYIGEIGRVIDILGTSTGDDGEQEQIVVVAVMGIKEVFMENQLKRIGQVYRQKKNKTTF